VVARAIAIPVAIAIDLLVAGASRLPGQEMAGGEKQAEDQHQGAQGAHGSVSCAAADAAADDQETPL
jgi:hypothetical protein